MANASQFTPEERARIYRARLEAESLPAAVIDSATAKVLAANALGLAALGLAADEPLPASLDSAAPILAVLSDVARAKPITAIERSLFISTAGNTTPVTASFSLADTGTPAHILVVFSPGTARTASSAVTTGAKEANPPSLATDDIAKLAHELKTPLAAIATAAEIMRDERFGPLGNARYRDYAADIFASASHALSVIQAMLTAPGASGITSKEKKPIDIAILAATTVQALRPLAESKELRLIYDGVQNVAPLNLNPTAIRQILINLLANALKFTPSGGEVRVNVGYLADATPFLSVSDSGNGMNEEAMIHALTDGDASDDVRPGGGRGIGLRLVRRLAAENAAVCEIDTQPHHGTHIRIRFAKAGTT